MALHKDLPVYKLAYDLLSLATDLQRNMRRDVKVSVGGRIRDESLTVLVLIGMANAAIDKTPHLTELLEHLHVVELLLRLAHDKQYITHSQYARSIQATDSIGAQVGAWRKAMGMRQQQQHEPTETPPAQASLFASCSLSSPAAASPVA